MQVKATPLAVNLSNILYGFPVFAFNQGSHTRAISLGRITKDTESSLFKGQHRVFTLLNEPIHIIVNMLFHVVIFQGLV